MVRIHPVFPTIFLKRNTYAPNSDPSRAVGTIALALLKELFSEEESKNFKSPLECKKERRKKLC